MLGTKNTNKKTAMGGVGIALLLCILMALSPLTGLVQNDTQTDNVDYVDAIDADDYDYFALPDVYEPVQYEHDETSEIEGMRSMNQKAFRTEDGKTSLITASEPLHYLDRDGSWDEIDLSVKATVSGWEVSENNYQTYFPAEAADGVAVTVHPNVDPIITGIAPMVMTIDESGGNPMPFRTTPSHEGVSVGGNMIRYPIAEGFDLDYTVETNQVKQNLIIRERPVLDENVAWFGLAEQMRLPVGHALYLGDDILREDLVQTQEELTIRNIETGEIIAVLPVPVVMEMESTDPYHATYFVQVFGQTVVLTTAVESSWLLDEERQFPLALDPSIKVTSGSGGYCYVYYGYCYNNTYRYLYRYYASLYYMPWNKYTFTSSNALPTGASIDAIDWMQYVSYSYGYSTNKITAVVMESCGTSNRYSYSVPTASCSGLLSSISYGYGGTVQRKMISSLWNSAAAGTYATGTGWKSASLCNSATACSATTGSHNYITNALTNSGSVGMGARYSTSTYLYHYAYTGGNSNSYIQITYSGGTDSTDPTSEYIPYTGITSYKEGERTFFTTFSDMSGIDTTSTGAPKLMYSVNNGTYTSVSTTVLGTCGSTDTECNFKATTANIAAGDFVNYYWVFSDLSSTPNTATDPSGGSGSTAPSTTFWFFVDDALNAGSAKKFTTLITERYASSAFTPGAYFDQQMTYYDNSDEYVIEFDTSSCGTGSSSCFYTTSYYFYSQWKMMWTTSSSSGYNGLGGTKSGVMEMHKDDGGFLSIAADDGPGMNLIYLYDSSANAWAMVGLGTSTGIDEPLSGGTSATYASTYGYTEAFRISIPGDFTGTFGKFDFNATYSSSGANWMCVGTNGWYYFFRSTSSSPTCTSGYYYIYSTSYRWAGMAFGSGYYGRQAASGDITFKVGKVAPEPDTTPPDVVHSVLRDSHSRDRTFSFAVVDAGDPPSGLNVNATTGEGPTLYYRITDVNGTVGNWASKVLSPNKPDRNDCILSACDWSTTVEDLERGSTTEYYMTATDNSTVAAGVNTKTTTTNSFEVGDPNKMFIVEWHDLGYTSSYTCNFQVVMYDVTNEIEFQYDTNCQAYYDYATVGYQDQSRTMGATLQQDVGYMAGGNPFSTNYRIGTESGGHGWEKFDLGMTELPTYDTAIAGSSNGYPYGYYCVSSYYWNTYKAGCNANIDLPDGFTFDYFGKEYNGSDTKNRVHIGRMGNMYLKDDGSTALERSMTTWYSNMPDMPYSGSSYSKPGNIAPWWSYYSSYYCYDTSSLDCSVRTRIVPFEGKGTDISADIVQPTTWSNIDSPIRINPSNDYLSIGDNLTIEPGVVIQVASGKGLSFDNACSPFIAVGNSTDHILFEGQNGGTWKGLAFTGACSVAEGTDDRHQMSYVDFANTTDAAIAAGSRHGATPSSNANVGNFTMDHVTFSNVGEAFAHGSGQGTALTMTDFEVNNAANACFNFAEDTIASLTNGEMNGCNDDGTNWGGAVVNYPGSTAGSLYMENVDISASQVNLIDVDFETVWISNVTGSTTSAQSGTVLGATGGGAGSSLYVSNLVATGYTSGAINSLDSISMTNVDLGSANIAMAPGGTSSTASGPSGSNAVFDTFTAGDITMARMAPMMDNINIGALTVSGNAPGWDAIEGTSWSTDGISINGCGYKVIADTVSTDWVSGSCSNAAAPNNIVLSDVTGTYTGTQSAIYARNSDITIGEGTWTMPSSFDKLAKASTNARIVLIAVSQDGTTCDGTGVCDTNSGSTGDIFFGGLATLKVYKLLGDGTKSYRSGHTVQTTVVDSGAGLFTVGTQRTDANGAASVWAISARDNGDTYADHNLAGWGPAGQNETLVSDAWYPGGFTVGDTFELRLEPAPVALNDTNMDCDYLVNHTEAALGYDAATNTFIWEGKITLSGDLTIDDCTVIVKSVFAVASDATNTPVLTIGSGGVLEFSSTSTDTGTLKAVSSSYPLHIDMDGGSLTIDNGVVRDLAANGVGTTGGLVVDSGTVTIMNGSTIYGNSGASTDHATIMVTDGTLDFDDSTIMNAGQTGMGLLFDGAYGSVDNIVVRNAEVGVAVIDSAPAVNGFNIQDSTQGVVVYGGMSLPTIYRSTLLSGQNQGWTTYDIDMSGYMGNDYLQVGMNSIYAGGNAHPSYNYASSKYYMIYDRMRIELTDNAGNSWNVTNSTDEGYVNGGGWDCNYYGYTYNPDYDYGYYYYMINYGGYTMNGSYNEYPSDFGFRWEAINDDITPTYAYPMKYWAYYSPSAYFSGVFAPPEGFNGMWGTYNVCLDYAYTYYMKNGQGARTTFPVIDLTANNITGVKMYVDVLHNRADNYQDRLDVVARSGNDLANLGLYARESGTPSFVNGQISGADEGMIVGGSWAAVDIDNVTISNPTSTGLLVDGSVASSVNDLTVEGGNYGILMSSAASGSIDITNANINNSRLGGVYYVKDVGGDFTGTITNSAGAGIKFGSATQKDISWNGMNLATNAIGIETAGSGGLTFTDSVFSNTKDFVISGSGTVDYIEGSVDASSVDVTGTGLFSRMRQLDVNVVADASSVSGANILLMNPDGVVTGTQTTDSNGDAFDLLFTTISVDSAGLTTENLAGYQTVTIAQIGSYSYSSSTSNSGDFRYGFETATLTDSAGNAANMDLVDGVDSRICYGWTSAYYVQIAPCAGSLSTGGSRTYSSGLKEYGYYGGSPTDMSNQVIMADVPWWYMDGDTSMEFNQSTILNTGGYTSYATTTWYSVAPYGSEFWMHDGEVISLAISDDGEMQGVEIGYFYGAYLLPNIQNSTLSGIASIANSHGYNYGSYYNWEADMMTVKNSVITHFRSMENTGSVAYEDMCFIVAGSNVLIEGNEISNCAVGVFVQRTPYYYSHNSTYWGADDAIIKDNTFKNTETLDVWFYLNSHTEGAEVVGNTFTGSSSPSYSVYTQDSTTSDLLIDGNTFLNADEAIYMRGATDWTITDNTITGKGDAALAGIYAKDGYGVIDGNDLTDADGGILIDGLKYGYEANVTNNNIGQTPGRVAPAAVGIWAEDCGSNQVNTGGNTIEVMENAIVTDGCDLTDSGSTLIAIGGSGGSVSSIQINANAYSPASLSIDTGDTIRWRANEYSSTGQPHTVTSNDTDSGGMPLWGSGGNMNLGSTYTRTFNTEGTFEYHCSTHTWMTGVITVSNGTSGTISSVGFSVAGGTDEIILDGTTISGFGIAIEQYGGDMTLSGDATLNGGSYAVYAEDTDVIVDGASLSASSTGSALYIFGASSLDANDMDTAGLYGINTNAVDFRWNYGNSVATTAVMADGGAEGSVENVTWADSTTEIDAGSYVTITSVGNSLTASKLIVDPTAVIHEGNLLNLNVTHKGGDASDVGLMIKSTDSAQAAYVSPAYRAPYVSADGDLSEWIGNALNPSDDAMPGVMSGDGSEDFLATWDANNLYMALTGVDMASADLQIYIDSSTGGETTGQSWYVAHSLPFAADYVYWAEDGDSANSGLKVNGFTGWADVTSSCSGLNDHVGYSGDTDTEISIPWDCIGNPSDTVRIIVIVQNESDGGIASVHPSQTVTADGNAQSFNDEITLMMGGSDLVAGDDLRDHLLIFRSYVGSNSPSDAKTYDLSVLVDATCEKDWGLIEDVDMSTNTWETINVERACPAISSLVDIKVNEDEGTYVLTLDDKATDVQDDDATLTWAVSDDADPTNSPSMLLNSALNVNDQEMTITPDNDQFGSYMFHYTVTDSNGLSDSTTIVFTVVNVNDAPIICNTERSDCMPVFADDGADNLNVLDEGFGSVSKVLGSAANATGSYVIDMASNDMANEQPQVYSWSAKIKGDDVTVDAYWVQKQYSSVAAMFDEVGAVITNNGGAQDIDMTGDPSGHEDTDITYTLPTLNNVSLLTYLLAQNGCGSVWYQEYMDSAGNKVTGVRSDDGCDSTIDTYGNVYSGLNYTQFWDVAYGVDVSTFSAGWDDVFANGYTTTAGNNPCVAFGVGVTNNELTITEDTTNELGGECTIVLSLQDDGGYCSNLYMGRTTNAKASCVAYTWLINYPVNHPVYGPITVTGCYNLYLGLPSFIPEYYPTGQATGMTSAICLAYSWNAENINAQDFEVNFSVTPVNDAPEVLDWDRQAGINIVAGNGSVPNFPWKVTLTEDDETLENLVYDLSAMKADADHADEDLVWSIVKATNCDYEEYFSATINDDDITFDLIKDATTNAPEWEVDYLNNGGRHQQTPLSGEFCPIILYLHDSASAPDAIPNYGMPTADYQQGEDSVTIYVRVQNVAENVPDYFMKDGPGFDFNGVTNIMTKTYVPTTVKIGHGGDEGPYNYDHMLQVTFMTNGYNNDEPDLEGYITLGTQYVSPPAYGEEISVSDKIFVTSTSTKVWATVDVLTCVDATCDMSKSAGDRFFGHSFPEAHRCIDSNDVQGEAWSCPGEVGRSSVDADGQPLSAVKKNNRRPMLEDQAWCNNIMSSEESGSDCAQPRTFGEVTLASNQALPTVVRLIGTSAVPSFAPSLIAISAAGLFVSALVLQSRREEDEEAIEEMSIEDDETAVSPVIATILMVAITVVLSGVIYVWAASLADTDVKGVPRMTFDMDSSRALDGENGHHRIAISSSQVDLATQAIDVRVQWSMNGALMNENYNLADPAIYGFGMDNTDTSTMVTFVDSVDTEKGATKSTFNTGDTIFIRTMDADGNTIEGMTVTITYNPGQGQPGAVLRQWTGL